MFAAAPPANQVMSQSADQSDVIEVIGHRADQALKIDRRTYQVQQTPHSQQKDGIQLLRGVPAVTVSPDEDISLLGSGNVTIFVDGRPYQGDPKSYLRSLHGSDIERIEIITNPSAQYSAEGAGGIINFVLRKKQGEGTSGTVSAEVSSLRHGFADATVKTKHGKWTYEFHAGGRAGTAERSHYYKLRSVEDAAGAPATINTEKGGGPYRGTEAEASAKVSYELSARSTMSARVLAADAHDVSNTTADFAGLTPDFQSFTQRQRFTTTASFLIGELNFDHKGAKEGETLSASLRVLDTPRQHEANAADFSNGGALSVDKLKRFLFVNGSADWQHPMDKGEILSVGGSWDYNRMSEGYRFTSIDTAGPPTADVSDEFSGRDSVLAGYATFQQPVGDWTVMPGLRVEQDSRSITSPGHPGIRVNRTDLFPTLHIDHALSKRLDLTLSYSKRIDRPQLNDLRPYAMVQDLLNVKLGNPHLKNQSTDAYELNLHYHHDKLDAGLIVYDRETRDLWDSVFSVVNGANVVTMVNSGHSRDAGAEIDVGAPIIARVKLNASINLFDQRVPVIGGGSDERFRYTTDATLQWTGPDRGKRSGDVAQLQWIYGSPAREFEIQNFAWNWLSLAYTHSFTQTVSLTGTLNYSSPNRHRLDAPLVQEYYAQSRPPVLQIKLLKTFGNH